MNHLDWKASLSPHRRPVLRRSLWQLANTVPPYLALWGAMIWSLSVSYWLTLALAVIAAGFLVRIFIIFHDCTHGSYFASPRANNALGVFTGLFTFTPYHQWRQQHAMHHGASGDLDRRGTGDIWTMTVSEYLAASRWQRLRYRLARNPLFLLVIGPLYVFLIDQRFPDRHDGPVERRWVHYTNLMLVGLVGALCWAIGWQAYLAIQLPVMAIAGAAGVWLFYVQHQFEGVYWERQESWDFTQAALSGSSFYKLPAVLQWFSGNIGFHHIHHLSPRIPNYNLPRCQRETPLLQEVRPITLFSSLRSLKYRLWDEQTRQLVGFGVLKTLRSGR